MKNLKFLFLVGLVLVLCLGAANATIVIDETFDDGTPWTDLGWAFNNANGSPTSASVKGISVFRYNDGTYQADMPVTATLAYNMTSGNQQGALVTLGAGTGKAWRLTQGQKIFWGQSGAAHVESGGGIINTNKDNITVAQIGVACDPAVMSLPGGTLVGQIRYMFGNTTTYTLTYNLRVNTTSNGLAVQEHRATRNFGGALARTVGVIPSNKFSMLTTVWNGKMSDTDANAFWGTNPKKYYTGNSAAPGIGPLIGSADGNLYPDGKGWAPKQKLTSATGATTGTLVYSFLDKKPVTASTSTVTLDGGWRILQKGDQANFLRTWKISVQDTPGATLVVDDIYYESNVRAADMQTDAYRRGADYRIHEFDQTKRYRPDPADPNQANRTMFLPNANPQYVTAGFPVELSVFEIR